MTPADVDKIILIGGPTRMPMVRQFVESVMGKEPERGIDPMEAVAMGAAIQGAVIAGDVSTDILLVDVTPLTLGVEVTGRIKGAPDRAQHYNSDKEKQGIHYRWQITRLR